MIWGGEEENWLELVGQVGTRCFLLALIPYKRGSMGLVVLEGVTEFSAQPQQGDAGWVQSLLLHTTSLLFQAPFLSLPSMKVCGKGTS